MSQRSPPTPGEAATDPRDPPVYGVSSKRWLGGTGVQPTLILYTMAYTDG